MINYHSILILLFLAQANLIAMEQKDSCATISDQSNREETNNCRELAIYDEKSHFPLEVFSQKMKIIEIDGRKYNLEQSWESIGVAGVVWDAAIVLSEYFNEHPNLVQEKRILELGAGTGLPSIVAINLGSHHVTSTDLPSSIPLLQRNILTNLELDQHSRIDIRDLTWGRLNVMQFMETIPSPQAIDLIIGADVVYNEEVFHDLIKTLSTVTELSSKHGIETKVILSMRLRYQRDQNFLGMLKNKFTSVDELHYDVDRDIHIYTCQKLR